MSEPFYFEGTFVHQTDMAVLVQAGDEDIWIPKSQIAEDLDWDDYEKEDDIEFTIPEWLAEEKGMV